MCMLDVDEMHIVKGELRDRREHVGLCRERPSIVGWAVEPDNDDGAVGGPQLDPYRPSAQSLDDVPRI